MKFSLIAVTACILLLSGCATRQQTSPEQPTPDTPDIEVTDTAEPEESAGLYNLATLGISASGTEPFWNFGVVIDSLTWVEPSVGGGPLSTSFYTMSVSQTPTTVTLTHPDITATLTLQPCSDGMSDLAYSHEVAVVKDGVPYSGCATVTS